MLPFMELPRTENRNPKAGVEPNKPLEAVGMLHAAVPAGEIGL